MSEKKTRLEERVAGPLSSWVLIYLCKGDSRWATGLCANPSIAPEAIKTIKPRTRIITLEEQVKPIGNNRKVSVVKCEMPSYCAKSCLKSYH